MHKLKCGLVLLMFLLSNVSMGQYTAVNGGWSDEREGVRGRIYSVEIDRTRSVSGSNGITIITIEEQAVSYKKRMNYWVGDYCHLECSGWTSRVCHGSLHSDGKLYDVATCGPYKTHWGWDNVAAGETRRYSLVFDGVPPGMTSISLVDNSSSCHGYSGNVGITNPHVGATKWTEVLVKQNADANNDGICGIYEEISDNNTGVYRLGCVKEKGKYYLVYLGSREKYPWWKVGDTKAEMEESATPGLFKAKWYMLHKGVNVDCILTFDGVSMQSFISKEKNVYMKMYPTAASNVAGDNNETPSPNRWSGTGWALGNGYVVTNNHVAEGAITIMIKGGGENHDIGYSAQVVATDKVNDLAILKITDSRFSGFGTLPYSVSSSIADVGEDIFVLGWPLGQELGEEIKLTTGSINSRTGFGEYQNCYQIQAPITNGNSGGPVFDSKGNIIGIVVGGLNKELNLAENVGYAIKTLYLKALIENADLNIPFPSKNLISTLSRPEKVKRVKKFVFLIECTGR